MTAQRTLKNIIYEQREKINTMSHQIREATKILEEIPKTPEWLEPEFYVFNEDIKRLRECLSQDQKSTENEKE